MTQALPDRLSALSAARSADLAPDPVQPSHTFGDTGFFAFGIQPIATRNAGKNEKVGIVGAGDVWKKFVMPSLIQRGSEVYVYDKKFEASCWQEKNPEIELHPIVRPASGVI